MKFKTTAAATAPALVFIAALLGAGIAAAQDAPTADAVLSTAPNLTSPLKAGPYIAPLGYYLKSDDKALGSGVTGIVNFGYRKSFYAMEVGATYGRISGEQQKGVQVRGLLFPFETFLPGLFGSIGAGAVEHNKHPETPTAYRTYVATTGLGYIFPLQFGRYEFGLRGEANYRWGHREKYLDATDIDLPIKRYFSDLLFGLGLQLPLGLKPLQPAAPVQPVEVVPVPAPACSDGIDNDGDGKIDYPADPGCSSADDTDETDPPPPPVVVAEPHCKTPGVGEKVSLKGCGTNDVIVLNGVNFEFNKASLTVNAKTILDDVATELLTYPEINVELSGHTDSKGSDSYNQRLSEKRAASVVQYLVSKKIAVKRMTSVGYGESKPVASNDTDEGREQNRRVELRITSGAAVPAPVSEAPAAADPTAGVASSDAPAQAPSP